MKYGFPRILLSVLGATALAISSANIATAEDTPDPGVVPDKALNKCVQMALEKIANPGQAIHSPTAVTKITAEDMEKLKMLSCSGVSDQKGLEYAKNLTFLYLQTSSMDSLDISGLTSLNKIRLEKNENLKEIVGLDKAPISEVSLHDNKFTSLDYSKLPNLKTLYVSEEKAFNTIAGLETTKIEKLYLIGTAVTELDATKLKGLTELATNWGEDFDGTDASVDTTNVKKIDVTGLTKLATLTVNKSKLEELKLGSNTALTFLRADNNNLKELDLSGAPNLTHVMLLKNPDLKKVTDLIKLADTKTNTKFAVPYKVKFDYKDVTLAYDSASEGCSYAAGKATCKTEGDHWLKFVNKELKLTVTFKVKVGKGEVVENPTDVFRLGGANRYETSVKISKQFATSGGVVFIATGRNFPDALSGGAAAAKLGGPLLLVNGNSIPASVKAELSRLKPAKVVVFGGPNAISDSVLTDLKSYSSTVERAAGPNRYDTAIAASRKVFTSSKSVIIASGVTFPDALSAGSLFNSDAGPILLSGGEAIDLATLSEIARLGAEKAYLIGGTSALNSAVANQLTDAGITVERFGGSNRYDTSLKVAKAGFPTKADTVYFATGKAFPDGLSAGSLLKAKPGPLVLTNGSCLSADAVSYVKSLKAKKMVILGGPNAVSDEVAKLTICK